MVGRATSGHASSTGTLPPAGEGYAEIMDGRGRFCRFVTTLPTKGICKFPLELAGVLKNNREVPRTIHYAPRLAAGGAWSLLGLGGSETRAASTPPRAGGRGRRGRGWHAGGGRWARGAPPRVGGLGRGSGGDERVCGAACAEHAQQQPQPAARVHGGGGGHEGLEHERDGEEHGERHERAEHLVRVRVRVRVRRGAWRGARRGRAPWASGK